MKKKTLNVLLCSLVIWSLTGLTFAESAEIQKDNDVLVKQALRSYFNQLAKRESFSGSVLIAREGKFLLKEGYGIANYNTGQPNRPSTVFAIASFTKAFTAMSVMILEERGLISVNDTVADYISGFPNGGRITIDHLLSHTSGLYDFLSNPSLWENKDSFHLPEQLLQYFMNEPLNFEPGTQFEYSNSNYITLGNIIERVSGMSFRDFIKDNILEPLNMRHTSYDPYEADFPRKAVGYDDLEPPVEAMYFNSSIPYSAGAMRSTAMDLYKWDQALYTEQLVSAATRERMFTPGLGDYGYGWYIDNLDVNGEMHKQIWHWGSYFGFHSYIARLVDDEVTIIILRNTPQVTADPQELRPIVEEAAVIIFENR